MASIRGGGPRVAPHRQGFVTSGAPCARRGCGRLRPRDDTDTRAQRIGRIAEDLAARRLRARGWRILERNARTRLGELDIVALDRGCLVFVEVKAGRRGSDYGPERPVLAVGPRKQSRLRRLAGAWMAANRSRARFREIRFDAIGVSFGRPDEAPGIEHLENAF